MTFPNIAERYDWEWNSGYYKDLAFLFSYLIKLHPKDAILDLACGTGRVAIEFAKKHQYVWAVDYDKHMLSQLRKKMADEKLFDNISLLQENIVTLNIENQRFSLITLMGNSIGIFETVKVFSNTCKKICHLLDEGGTFICCQHHISDTSPVLNRESKPVQICLANNFVCSRTFELRKNDEKITVILRYWRSGQLIHKDVIKFSYFQWTDIKKSLEGIFGKLNVSVYGDYDRNMIKEDSEYAIFVCKKG